MRLALCSAALILALVSGCSGANDEAMSEEDFRAATKVGSFATMADADVDKIAQAYCADLDNIEGDGENSADDLRFVSPIVLAPQAESDAGAVLIAQAFTGRYCVQHAHLFE